MAKSKKALAAENLSDYIKKLDRPLADIVEAIRQSILSIDKEIGEQVKWNSPSFFYTGEMKPFDPKEYKRDIVVLNLHRGFPLLIFPTGARIGDTSGFLEGKYADGRRMATIKDKAELKAKEKMLKVVIKKWLTLVEK